MVEAEADDEMMSDKDEGKRGEESEEYDPFAVEKYEDPIMQKCWLILGELYYHYEATDFLEPITPENFGAEMYEDYCNVID